MANRRNKNPNQMALPGMEELSHPGAKVVAEPPHGDGLMFGHYVDHEYGEKAHLWIQTPEDESVSNMDWHTTAKPGNSRRDPVKKGEIEDIYTDPAYRRSGHATAMWHIGRQMLPYVKPQHSPDRTPKGEKWAKSVGGRLPKLRPAQNGYFRG